MKIDDVKIGGEYWTRVSGSRVRVRAVAIVEREIGWRTGRAAGRVNVARADNGLALPKSRSAAALEPAQSFDRAAALADPAVKEQLVAMRAAKVDYRAAKLAADETAMDAARTAYMLAVARGRDAAQRATQAAA